MTYRTKLALRALPASLITAVALAGSPASAAPVAVDLRVEGNSSTIYENLVTTDGHTVTTASGGTHKCDGTNGGVNPTAGPTATGALDDGAKLGGFSWDGTYSDGFDDYLVSRIGPDSSNQSQFWALAVDSEFSQTGGCQQRVGGGQEVLWAFDGFSKQHFLRLSGPEAAVTDQAFSVRVTDGANGSPLAGASVRGTLTGPDGRASVSLSEPGIYRLKAERADSVRSNELEVCVDPPGAAPCTSFDKAAPSIRLMLPEFASDTGRSRNLTVAWLGDDGAAGSGVTSYDLDARRVATGARRSAVGAWKPLQRGTVLTRARFKGLSGAAYEFRVSGIDRARNRSGYALGRVVVPIDDRDRRLFRVKRGGWRRLARKGAWGGRVLRSRRPGAVARVRFRGRRIALIGRKLRRGGRLLVSVDGRHTVVSLRGRSRFRQVLFVTGPRRAGRHTLRFAAVGGGPVEIDAVAPIP